MPRLPLKTWNGLPVIYEGNGHIKDFVVRNGNVIETNIDIVASSFFMLSRYEEILVDAQDEYGRFPATASIAYKENFLTRPIVNEYIDLLWNWIDSLELGFKRRKLWNGKDFAACLTHDVDTVRKWSMDNIYHEILCCGSMALKKRKPLSAGSRMTKAALSMLSLNDPYWSFNSIMNLEERYGFSSSFYFFGGGRNPKDATYSIHDNKMSRLLLEIQDRGNEVGVHGSFDSYNNLEILRYEKANLEELVGNISSIRQHFLRFHVEQTFAIYEELGIGCDVTLGFANHEGFRAGICLPFHPYNIEKDKPYDVIEIPLTIMDCTLGAAGHRGLGIEESWQSVESLLAAVKGHGGCIVLLWHNSYMDKFEYPGYAGIYARILKYIAENNGMGMPAKTIYGDFQQFC